MSRDLHQKALQLELKKRYLEAGECWEQAGQVEKAIANYQRGGDTKSAVDLALRAGLKTRAAEVCLKAERFDQAAELYREARDFARAARAYRLAGKIAEAMSFFEKAEEFTEAARLHESINDFKRAGELYERGGDLESSARMYELLIDAKATHRLGGKKDLARVAQVLTRVRSFEKAAEMYVRADEVAEAVLAFVRMGEVEGAARLLANCQGDVGAEVVSRIEPDEEAAPEFARLFDLARDYARAARVFAGCGRLAEAAERYARVQDYEQAALAYQGCGRVLEAAEMFERGGASRKAAEAYLEAGENLRAAACFETAGDAFAAGRLHDQAGGADKALELLQQVVPEHPGWGEASTRVAELLRSKGHDDLAVERYRRLIAGGIGPQTVEAHYRLACLLAERGALEEAERLFGSVIGFQFTYQDAAQRLEAARRARQGAVTQAVPRPGATTLAMPVPPSRDLPAASAPGPPAAGEPAAPPPPGGRVVGRLEGLDALAATPLFCELSLAEIKRFVEVGELRRVAAGELVLEEGIEGPGLFVLRQGAMNVMKGDEVVVQLQPGDFFGEMSLVDQSASTSARVVAALPSELFFLGRNPFNRLIAASDATALKMYRVFVGTLCDRLRKATEELTAARGSAAG